MKPSKHIITILILLLTAQAVRASTTIELRESATVAATGPIIIEQIADLTGEDADTLKNIVVIPDAGSFSRGMPRVDIDLAHLRSALNKNKVNWGRIALHGSICSVRVGTPNKHTVDNEAPNPYETPELEQPPLEGPPTIRRHIINILARRFDASPKDLRLHFRKADTELLARIETWRRVEIEPTAISSTIPVTIRIYEHDRIVLEKSIRVRAEVRRTTVTARAEIARNKKITADMLRTEPHWLTPGVYPIDNIDDAIALKTRARIAPGKPITPSMLDTPVVVRRGQLVTVRCLSGGIALTGKARALEPGRIGDVIECKMVGAENAFLAKVDAPGRVISNLDDAHDPSEEA